MTDGGGGGYGYDTPANQPAAALRHMHSGGSGGLGGNARAGRHLSGGGMGAGMAAGGLLAAQLGMGGGGISGSGMGARQAMQNDRRQSMGLPGSGGFQCAREWQRQAGAGRGCAMQEGLEGLLVSMLSWLLQLHYISPPTNMWLPSPLPCSRHQPVRTNVTRGPLGRGRQQCSEQHLVSGGRGGSTKLSQ